MYHPFLTSLDKNYILSAKLNYYISLITVTNFHPLGTKSPTLKISTSQILMYMVEKF